MIYMERKWIRVNDSLPPVNRVVETKIDDGANVRNEQELKYMGNLWFIPDGSMYVYYTPTHWREQTHPNKA